MKPKLYMIAASPPVRCVLLTEKALGLDLEHIEINVWIDENLKPEYVKINPQHTVPCLDDNGFIIWDSHAIAGFLVGKYGKDDSLYPKDIYKRAVVDQRLHFDTGNLYPLLLKIFNIVHSKNLDAIEPEQLKEVHDTYGIAEKFLEGKKWACGDNVTIADFSMIPSMTSFDFLVPIDKTKYPNLTAWIRRAQQWSYYSANQVGLNDLRDSVKEKLP